jgi:hypothetical protein
MTAIVNAHQARTHLSRLPDGVAATRAPISEADVFVTA